MIRYVELSHWATVGKCQKSKIVKFNQFFNMHIQQIICQIRGAQPFHFKNLQEDFGHLWNGHHCTESPVNQNQTFVEASVFPPKEDGS